MEEFVKWCFKDETSGFVTVFVGILLGQFIIEVIRSIRNK